MSRARYLQNVMLMVPFLKKIGYRIRRAKNSTTYSKTQEELINYRKTHFSASLLEQTQPNAIIDNSLEKQDENSINIKNKFPSMSPNTIAMFNEVNNTRNGQKYV